MRNDDELRQALRCAAAVAVDFGAFVLSMLPLFVLLGLVLLAVRHC